MLHHRTHKNSDFRKIQTYNSIKDQLQNQNAILMKQRYNITQQLQTPTGNLPYNSVYTEYNKTNYEQSLNQSPSKNGQPGHGSRIVDILRMKVEEVIELCEGCEENLKEFGEIGEVIEAEREILNFLNGINLPSSRKNRSSSSKKKGSSKKKHHKLNKTQAYEPNQMEGYRQFIGDQAMEMIEEIERKALRQIQNLRTDKINLMRRLNQEIKAHNQEKKLRVFNDNQSRNAPQINIRTAKPQKQDPRQDYKQMEVVEEENEQNFEGSPVQPLPQDQVRPQSQHRTRTHPHQPKHYSHFHPNSAQNVNNERPQPPTVSNLHSRQLSTQQQIYQEMERARNENQRIKAAIAGNHSLNGNIQLKQQLRSQVGKLQNKIHRYEGILSQSKRQQGATFDIRQFQNLFAQANQISQEGNRLLRNKKGTQHNRTTIGSSGNQEPNTRVNRSFTGKNTSKIEIKQEEHYEAGGGRGTFDYTRPPLQTFSPMDKSYHSQTYKNGFSPSQYENIIEKMRNATKV